MDEDANGELLRVNGDAMNPGQGLGRCIVCWVKGQGEVEDEDEEDG